MVSLAVERRDNSSNGETAQSCSVEIMAVLKTVVRHWEKFLASSNESRGSRAESMSI